MLVLSRKCNQEIVVNGNIRIHIVSISGNTVRLGIDAPRDIGILRGELVSTADHVSSLLPDSADSRLSVDSKTLELQFASGVTPDIN